MLCRWSEPRMGTCAVVTKRDIQCEPMQIKPNMLCYAFMLRDRKEKHARFSFSIANLSPLTAFTLSSGFLDTQSLFLVWENAE